jgi:hypothetical protein
MKPEDRWSLCGIKIFKEFNKLEVPHPIYIFR